MKQLLGMLGLLSVACGAVCGDEKVEEAEACDDGNNIDADGCEADCSLPACGNGIIDPGELCFVLKSFSVSDGVSGIGPTGVALADLDGDNLLDIATANTDSDDVSLLTNLGGELFSAPQFLTTGDVPTSLIAVDLQGDGSPPELVCTNALTDDITVFFDNGDVQAFSVGVRPTFLASGDIEGDGSQDVVVSNLIGDSISVLLNPQGTGTLSAAVEFPVGDNPGDVLLADVDDDGNLDIILSEAEIFDISVLFGVGDGTFELPLLLPLADNIQANGAVVTDFDEDGNQDILFTENSGTLRLFVGDGNRQFSLSPLSFPAGNAPFSPRLVDLNNDARLDVIVRNLDGVSILLGQGAEQFSAPQLFPTGSLQEPETGDLNGDGVPDVVVADIFVGEVDVLFSNP